MSRTSNRANGDVIRDFLSVADLLKEPHLAKLYAYLAHEEESTVQDVMEEFEFAQGTAYSYVNRLVDIDAKARLSSKLLISLARIPLAVRHRISRGDGN